MTADPFGTRGLREAAVAAWTAQPARFREDANTEEDHGRGYYRDRVVVELAQNAADAAARAGAPGRLLLRLTTDGAGGTLLAANTGSPLDAAGVASLASLRASAKRGGAAVGRFGVGFAAVRSVADEVTVASTTGAVHFSLPRTKALLDALLGGVGAAPDARLASLAAEVGRRGDALPVLRLPFEGPGDASSPDPDDGWDTAVVLRLRDTAAVAEVRRQLDGLDDALLLALPALGAVQVQVDGAGRVLADVVERWVVARRSGRVPAEVLADRPVEERERTDWQVTWAVRRSGGHDRPTTVHAPTPTDEPTTLPALLIGTFPLDPSRRHVAPGPLTDHLVDGAGSTWADLLAACRDAQAAGEAAPDPLDLLTPDLPAGALDAALRERVVAVSRDVPVLTPADGGPAVAPSAAVVLDGPAGQDPAVLRTLGAWMPALVGLAPRHRHLLRALGIGTTTLGDVLDALPHAPPDRMRTLYDALDGVAGDALEELGTLPVPLADGRTVRGARGLVLADADVDPEVLTLLGSWGLRAVHPQAAHPVLERLGATRAGTAELLRHPVLAEQVLSAHPDDLDPQDDGPRDHGLDGGEGADEGTAGRDPAARESDAGRGRLTPAARVLLGLVEQLLGDRGQPAGSARESGRDLDGPPWWGEVLLPADDGEPVPARGLVLPGSQAGRWFDPDVLPTVDRAVAARWGPALAAVGVRAGLPVVRVPEAEVDPEGRSLVTDGLDGWDQYVDEVAAEAGLDQASDVPVSSVVADLDAVRREAWPDVLVALTRGEARAALLDPVHAPAGPGAPRRRLPSYTAWWLRRRAGLGLDRPFALNGAHGAVGALLGGPPPAVHGLDDDVLRVLGGVRTLDELPPDGWLDLLAALPAESALDLPVAVAVWRGLAALATADPDLVLDADAVPALLADGTVRMVPAEEVAVAGPLWAQRRDVGPLLLVPTDAVEALADALDCDAAAEREPGEVASEGQVVPTPDAVRAVWPGVPATWVEHDDLRVDGERVEWWVTGAPDGQPTVHAATAGGLARALASTIGWSHRDAVERVLADPGTATVALLELAGDDLP